MTDQIVLLETSKEVTTFLLDDGDISSKEVITTTGQNIGYEYTNKLFPEDTVTISGEQKYIDNISNITANIDVTDITKETVIKVPLSADNITTSPNQIEVTVTPTKK